MLDQLADFVKANPILAGVSGATVAGYLIANAKTLPEYLWRVLKAQFSTELIIWSEDSFFTDFDRWLAQHPSTKKMRSLAVAEWHNRQSRSSEFALTPGPGLHILWHGRRPFFIHRMVEDSKGGGDSYSRKRKQTLTLTTPGRKQAPILALLGEIRRIHEGKDTVEVYIWNGVEPMLVDRRAKRSMDTVYCTEILKTDLIADIEKFFASRELYHNRGVPYRRGYLLEGPPGCGKTTMIYALASLLEKAIYVIPAGAIGNDKELIGALNAAEDHLVVIEDIDALPASESRENGNKHEAVADTSKAGITQSGLLNGMDGLSAREGRVLFVTTNKPDIIDPAILRDGRIDVRRHFAPAGPDEALAMFTRFHPGADPAPFMAEIAPQLPMAQAELQTRLLRAI